MMEASRGTRAHRAEGGRGAERLVTYDIFPPPDDILWPTGVGYSAVPASADLGADLAACSSNGRSDRDGEFGRRPREALLLLRRPRVAEVLEEVPERGSLMTPTTSRSVATSRGSSSCRSSSAEAGRTRPRSSASSGRYERRGARDAPGVIADAGQYPFVTTPDEFAEYEADPAKVDAVPAPEVSSAEEDAGGGREVAGTGVRCFVSGANDDSSRSTRIAGAELVEDPNGTAIELEHGVELLGMGYGNPTPWACPRDVPEQELADRIDDVAARVGATSIGRSSACTCRRWAPGWTWRRSSTTTDAAGRRLDLETIPVGSTATRDAILRYQPMLGLHGHIHESKGVTKLDGVTVANPGERSTARVSSTVSSSTSIRRRGHEPGAGDGWRAEGPREKGGAWQRDADHRRSLHAGQLGGCVRSRRRTSCTTGSSRSPSRTSSSSSSLGFLSRRVDAADGGVDRRGGGRDGDSLRDVRDAVPEVGRRVRVPGRFAPVVGFVVSFSFAFWETFYTGINGAFFSLYSLSPMLAALGVQTGQPAPWTRRTGSRTVGASSSPAAAILVPGVPAVPRRRRLFPLAAMGDLPAFAGGALRRRLVLLLGAAGVRLPGELQRAAARAPTGRSSPAASRRAPRRRPPSRG